MKAAKDAMARGEIVLNYKGYGITYKAKEVAYKGGKGYIWNLIVVTKPALWKIPTTGLVNNNFNTEAELLAFAKGKIDADIAAGGGIKGIAGGFRSHGKVGVQVGNTIMWK
jgi:hypothetical protein